MHWKDIIGQTRITAMLQRAIAEDRIPQALLLVGPDGTGTLPIALAFATTVNCRTPVRTPDGIEPCGHCQSCIQASTLQHPNIRLVTALPAGKGDTDDDMKADLVDEIRDLVRHVAEDPYTTVRVEGATQIRIGQIRDLKRSLSLSAAQEGRRVIIVHEAHEMTTEASNAFLKTLEEPHENVTILLTSSHPERMLQTIVSRCQLITCPPIDDVVLAEALVRRGLCSADEASLIAPFAEGSMTRAADFLDEDMKGDRQVIVDLLRTALRGKDHRLGLVEVMDSVADGRDKPRLVMMLSLLQLWLRDAMAMSQLGGDAPIVNIDQHEALQRFAEAYRHADYGVVFTAIDEAVRNVHRNVAPPLIIIPLMLRLRAVFQRARMQMQGGTT